MRIICNGEERTLPEGMRLAGLVHTLGLEPTGLVAQCDGLIVAQAEFDCLQLEDGMVLELIRFVGGG